MCYDGNVLYLHCQMDGHYLHVALEQLNVARVTEEIFNFNFEFK